MGQANPDRCIFCGGSGLVEATIWPDWLDQIVPKDSYLRNDDGSCPVRPRIDLRRPLLQRPRLACEACDSGWISALGQEVRQFLEPALRGLPVDLTVSQGRALAGWLCLLATTTAYLASHCGISSGDRSFLRHTRQPTRSWSIFMARLNGRDWSKACKHNPYRIEFSGNPMTTHSHGRDLKDCNTQLLSFGIGPLFFHIFTSPSLLLQSEFARTSRSQRLSQLWPPERRFGLMPARPMRLPPARLLTDDEAWDITDNFADLLRDRLIGRAGKAAAEILPAGNRL